VGKEGREGGREEGRKERRKEGRPKVIYLSLKTNIGKNYI
jgi:hypothetical protein